MGTMPKSFIKIIKRRIITLTVNVTMCYFYSMPRDLTKDDGIFFCPDLKKYRDIIIST